VEKSTTALVLFKFAPDPPKKLHIFGFPGSGDNLRNIG